MSGQQQTSGNNNNNQNRGQGEATHHEARATGVSPQSDYDIPESPIEMLIIDR